MLDASIPDASTAMDAGSCAGELIFDICWYLAAEGQNCQNHCAAHGGFDNRSTTHVGTPAQGGSRDDCQQILNALGHTRTVAETMRTDGMGLGCHVWENGDTYWLVSPSFNPNISLAQNAPFRIACGCQR